MSVNVEGIDRVELLKALWEGARTAPAYFAFTEKIEGFDLELAHKYAKKMAKVDYFCGRVIKTPIFQEENEMDPWGYDRDNGSGAFQRVVDALRK